MRDDALTKESLMKMRLAEVEDELRNIKEGVVVASENRAKKSELAAEQAQEQADSARRELADAEALTRKVSKQFQPVTAATVESALISSWKYEAARLLRRMRLLRTTNRALECEAMRTHDFLRPQTRGGSLLVGFVVFVFAALATAAALHAAYEAGVLEPYLVALQDAAPPIVKQAPPPAQKPSWLSFAGL
eukprot:Hpha_TRINITY_DN15220_c0_g4::TRINITY_DN15220_c0_g4_i3::g.64544::m.64544